MSTFLVLSGSDSLAAEGLARILADCPTWQRGCGVASAALARDFIYFRNAVGTVRRPYAVISPGDEHGYNLIAGGAQNYLRPDGNVFLYMAHDTEPPFVDDNVEAEFDATNFFGSVIDEIACQAGQDDKLSITNIRRAFLDETPETDWQSLGRYWFCGYFITWGDS